MLLYQQTAAPATLWSEPMELIWQMQPADWASRGRLGPEEAQAIHAAAQASLGIRSLNHVARLEMS